MNTLFAHYEKTEAETRVSCCLNRNFRSCIQDTQDWEVLQFYNHDRLVRPQTKLEVIFQL